MASLTAQKSTQSSTSLKELGVNNGLKYFLPVVTSFSSDCRGCLVPVSASNNLEKNGWGFYGVDHYKMDSQDPEMFGIPDPSTLIKMPWKPDVGFVSCNLLQRGKPFSQCPRSKLIELQRRAKELGFVMKTGLEPEFILLKKSEHCIAEGEIDTDLRVYHEPHNLLNKIDFIQEVTEAMETLGWNPYQAEHEAVAGQYEFNFGFTDCLEMADRHTFMKFLIKEVALKHNCRATFMPLPFPGKVMGSGLHLNLSLWDCNTGKNLFPDSSSELGLSTMAQHFTAGVLAHAQALTAIMCPSVNSYKRLHSTTIADGDACVCWGRETRYPSIRIPNNERIELRWGDGASNPYLLQAAVLAAGIDGITNKIPLDDSMRIEIDMHGKQPPDHLKRLPKNLQEAYLLLDSDEVLKKYLGKDIVEGFVHMKKKQWNEFMSCITKFEIELADDY